MMTSLTEGKSSASDPKRDNRRAMTVRILLVDDFEPCRTLVSLILQDQPGYQIVGEASSGPQAIERIAELSPELVVLDIGLPGLNGIEVARQIRNCSPGSTILFLTGDHDPEVARRALYVGARGYV